MKKNWIYLIVFLFFLAFAFFIPITNSEIINSFNDSSTSKNFTGDGFWSNLTYITLPKYATINSATINLTGHSTSVPSDFASVTVIQDMAISDTSNIAMTVDSKNETHIVVCDYTTADVFYINGSGSSWSSTTITTSLGGWYCDIEVDSNDKPHICYTNDDSADLYYANKTGSSWTSTEIAGLYTLDYGGCAIDINSYDDVAVVFSTQGGTNDQILFKLYNSTTKSWSTETINTGNGINSFTLDVVFDTLDNPHVIYDIQGAATSTVSYANKTTGTWQVQTVDSSDDVGWGSLILDSNKKTHIAYKNKGSTYALKYANNSDGLTSWTSVTLDSTFSDDSSIGIGVDSDNVIKIAYNNYNATGKYLRYASYQNNVWTTQTVAFSSSASYIRTDLRVKDDLSYIAGINGTTLFHSSNTASSSSPSNVTLDVSNDGDVEFNHTGSFTTTNTTIDLASEINTYLSTCTPIGDYCDMPLNISGMNSTLEIGSLNINYTEIPRISILSPSNYTNQTRLEINYSSADLSLDSCWWTADNGVTNTTITCGDNITSGISDGLFINFTVYVNDSDNNINYSKLTFSLDTTSPTVNIIYPTDYQSFNFNENINVNFTRYDTTFGINSCWWSNDSGVNNNTLATPTDTNISVTEAGDGNYIAYVWCNDTLNNVGTDLIHYTVSLSSPAIDINYPSDNTWFQNGTNINFNVTATDDNGIRNCSLWGNWTGTWHLNQTNTTAITSGVLYSFNQTIPDSNGLKYKFGFECFDETDTGGFSTNFTFGVDEINPLINLTYPFNISYNSVQTLLNYTIAETNPNACWYSLNSGVTNTTVTCGTNLTGLTSNQGSNTWKVWINDSANRINSSSKTFFVDSINPLVSLSTSFSDGDYLNYNESIEINVTASDTNLNTCFYNIDLGTNNTFTCGNNLSLNVSNGVHTVYVYANDTLNNLNGSETISFTSDTIYPIPIINSINTTINYWVFSFNSSVTETNPNNCFYSIFNSSDSIEGLFSNISISCDNTNSTSTFVSAYSTFNLFIYANDSAGNLNYTNKTFTTAQSSTSSGGGGGATPPATSEVISLIQPLINISEQNNLSRAIIYAEIRRSCLDKNPCILNSDQKNELLVLLDSLDIIINLEELNKWIDSYNKNYLEVVKLEDSQINQYNLFTGILQVDKGNLIANPSRLDPFPPYFIFSSDKPVFRTKIKFNKVINDSSMLEGSDSSLSVNWTSTEATIILNITDSDWASKVFTGTASFTSLEGDVTFVPINLRVINVRNGFTIITGVIFLGIIGLTLFFGKQISKTFKLKKITKEINKRLKT